MPMIQLKTRGSFNRSTNFLKRILKMDIRDILDSYGQRGVEELRKATPKDTGKTADSWNYTVDTNLGGGSLTFSNSNINDGVNIAIIIQYGHGTGWGGYVQGIDYINPALKPIFDEIADRVWEEVARA